jgi:hypothetical protein
VLRSSTSGLAEAARLSNRPGVAAVSADRKPHLGRSVRISVALGVSGSLALALVLDQTTMLLARADARSSVADSCLASVDSSIDLADCATNLTRIDSRGGDRGEPLRQQ